MNSPEGMFWRGEEYVKDEEEDGQYRCNIPK
jgi:hypothetical protein